MFFFGKSLQAAALGVVALALYVGLTEVQITKELTMMALGICLFMGGRLVEGLGTH